MKKPEQCNCEDCCTIRESKAKAKAAKAERLKAQSPPASTVDIKRGEQRIAALEAHVRELTARVRELEQFAVDGARWANEITK